MYYNHQQIIIINIIWTQINQHRIMNNQVWYPVKKCQYKINLIKQDR